MDLNDVMQPLLRHWGGLFGLPDLDGHAECVRARLAPALAKLQEQSHRVKNLFAPLAHRAVPASPA